MANRNKDLLYPAFAKQLEAFEQLLSEAGLPFYLFEGVRTFKEQDHLYSLGRTMPGRIVTSAQEIGRAHV